MGKAITEGEREIKGVRHSREVHAKLVDELTLKMDRLIDTEVMNFSSVTQTVALGHKTAAACFQSLTRRRRGRGCYL